MLTGRLIRVRYARDRLIPSYVDAGAPEWQEIGERLLTLFRGREGATRGELEEDVKESFGSDPQTLVHQGLAKVLEDRCEFEVVSDHPPEQLRELVFSAAAQRRAAGGIVAAPGTQDITVNGQGLDRAAVLAEVAERIRLRVRSEDILGRIDADEFALICLDASPEQLDAVRTNLEAFVSYSETVPAHVSIGVAVPERHDESGVAMLARARSSMRHRRDHRPAKAIDEALHDLITAR